VKTNLFNHLSFMNRRVSAFLVAATLTGASLQGSELPISVSASSALANRYVTEGIDNLPDADAVFQGELVLGWESWSLGALYFQPTGGMADNEVNVFLEKALSLGAVGVFGGIEFLTFPASDEGDTWEVFLGVDWDLHPYLTLFAETIYDIDAVKGGFVELGASTLIPQPLEGLELKPYALLGLDFGYVSEGRRLKENHAQVGLKGTYALTDHLGLFASLQHSFALSNLDDEGEGDVTWGMAGVSLEF